MPPKPHPTKPRNSISLLCSLGLALYLGTGLAQAQDIAHPSLFAGRAAEPIFTAQPPASRYNVKAGPVKMLLGASMGASYNSNVNVSNDNAIGSMVLSPRVTMGVYWPITKLNKIRLNISAGYDYYMSDPNLGGQTLLISPETEFTFKLSVGDVSITFFDRPSVTNNPVDNPTLSDAVNYTILNNTAGISLLWDLNDVLLGAGYSNFINYALNDDFNYLSRMSNQLFGNASLLVLPYLRLGVEGTATATTYSEGSSAGASALNDSLGYTFGLTAEATLSRYLEVNAGGGWQISDFSESNNPLNTGNYSKPYFFLAAENTLNRYFSHRLSTGFEGVPSSESNWLALFYVRYSFNWMLIRDWSLGGSAFFEHGTESNGPEAEDFHRVGGNINLNYQLSDHWVLSLFIGGLTKTSTRGSYDYTQQQFGGIITYTF